jgi:2'-5' RNA ligase
MPRLFLGIRPPAHVRKKIYQHVHPHIVEGDPALRITNPKNWHITVHFIGDVTPLASRKIVELFKKTKLPASDFRPAIQVGGDQPISRFGNEVLYLDVHDVHGHLSRMHAWSRELIPVVTPHEKYNPHLTLARNPKGISLADLVHHLNKKNFSETFHPVELILYDSKTVEGKTIHRALARRRFSFPK